MTQSFFIILLCMLAGTSSAYAQDAEKALKEFEGKVLVLRHPLHGESQQYDAQGAVLKGGAEESWTTHGGMLIEHIALTPAKLHLDGRRTLFYFSKDKIFLVELKKKRFNAPPIPPNLDIEIALDHPIDSEEQARKILSQIFALNVEELLASSPDGWRPCLTGQLTYDPLRKKEEEFRWTAADAKSKWVKATAHVASANDSSEPVTHVGDGVLPPKALFTPEPKFSKIAYHEKFQGVSVLNIVVGTDGHVHKVRLVRPLGLGQDESAMAMIQTWRFQPATRNAEPVAVEMNVEVAFNLY